MYSMSKKCRSFNDTNTTSKSYCIYLIGCNTFHFLGHLHFFVHTTSEAAGSARETEMEFFSLIECVSGVPVSCPLINYCGVYQFVWSIDWSSVSDLSIDMHKNWLRWDVIEQTNRRLWCIDNACYFHCIAPSRIAESCCVKLYALWRSIFFLAVCVCVFI